MRGLFIVFQEEIGFQENIKILVIRNNKIMTGQPTHTPRGAFTQPRGAFDSFQGLQVASNLGLNLRKRSSRHQNKKHSRGAPQRAQTKDKTSIKDSVDINDKHKTQPDHARLNLANISYPLAHPVRSIEPRLQLFGSFLLERGLSVRL